MPGFPLLPLLSPKLFDYSRFCLPEGAAEALLTLMVRTQKVLVQFPAAELVALDVLVDAFMADELPVLVGQPPGDMRGKPSG